MLLKNILLGVLMSCFSCITLKAQLFETRSTKVGGENILTQLKSSGNQKQIGIRDSIIKEKANTLKRNNLDTIETFFDGYHMGLVIYRDGKPFNLIGFWDPKGDSIYGGNLTNGNGHIQTPFNQKLTTGFKNESVTYIAGIKNGYALYYCDCASVIRKGTFKNNQKTGLWKEFSPNGAFIRQTKVKVPPPKKEKDKDKIKIKDWRQPAHCMMRQDEVCPK